MKITSVYCVGAGGTASHFIPNAARLMAYHPDGRGAKWKIQDGDSFEEKNHSRQAFDMRQCGQNKAKVLAERISPVVSSPIDVHQDWCGKSQVISWLYDLKALQDEADDDGSVGLILTLVDNYKTRAEIYQAIADVPGVSVAVIDPGNGMHNGQVNTWVRVGNYQLWESPLVKSPLIKNPPDRKPADGCIELAETEPQLMVANIMAATLSLQALWALLTDMEYPLHEQQEFDLMESPVAIVRGSTLVVKAEEENNDGQ